MYRGTRLNLAEKKFDKDLFLAEYNTLRQEILQRVSHQTTIAEISITAWGLILAYALQEHEPSDATGIAPDNYNDIFLLLIYPLLACFISFSWAFNNTRICQIGSFLRGKEEMVSRVCGELSWEREVYKGNLTRRGIKPSKIKHGLAIFIGTQVASLFLVVITVLTAHASLFTEGPKALYMIIFLFVVDLGAIGYTYYKINGSED